VGRGVIHVSIQREKKENARVVGRTSGVQLATDEQYVGAMPPLAQRDAIKLG